MLWVELDNAWRERCSEFVINWPRTTDMGLPSKSSHVLPSHIPLVMACGILFSIQACKISIICIQWLGDCFPVQPFYSVLWIPWFSDWSRMTFARISSSYHVFMAFERHLDSLESTTSHASQCAIFKLLQTTHTFLALLNSTHCIIWMPNGFPMLVCVIWNDHAWSLESLYISSIGSSTVVIKTPSLHRHICLLQNNGPVCLARHWYRALSTISHMNQCCLHICYHPYLDWYRHGIRQVPPQSFIIEGGLSWSALTETLHHNSSCPLSRRTHFDLTLWLFYCHYKNAFNESPWHGQSPANSLLCNRHIHNMQL